MGAKNEVYRGDPNIFSLEKVYEKVVDGYSKLGLDFRPAKHYVS